MKKLSPRVSNGSGPREWWIGRTEDHFDKWLTRKNPEETECLNVFITSDGSEPCVEYIPVIEKSAYEKLEAALVQIRDMKTNADDGYYDCLKIAEDALK